MGAAKLSLGEVRETAKTSSGLSVNVDSVENVQCGFLLPDVYGLKTAPLESVPTEIS